MTTFLHMLDPARGTGGRDSPPARWQEPLAAFARLAAGAPALVCHLDADGRVDWANPLLLARHQGTGPPSLDTLFTRAERAKLLRAIKRAHAGGARKALEWVLSDGPKRRSTFALVVSDADDGPSGCLLVCMDTTRLAHAGAQRNQLLLDGLHDLAWTAGADGVLDWRSHHWEELQWLGGSLLDAVVAEDRETVRQAWEEACRSLHPLRVEARLESRREGQRWYLLRMHPLLDSAGQLASWCGIGTDIDDRTRAMTALRFTRQRVDAFLAVVSHELRNPLAAMTAALQLKRHPQASRRMTARALDSLERQVGLMTRMVDDLLDIARLAEGRLLLQYAPVSAASLIADVCADLQPCAAPLGIELAAEPPAPALVIAGDAARLHQALGNLVHNALRATPAGGRIWLEAEARDGEMVVLRVSDTGVGLSDDELGSLFEPGHGTLRHGPSPGDGGLGLGLRIVTLIAELHGGRASGRSDGKGRGAVFEICLPVNHPAGAGGTGLMPQSAPASMSSS